MLAFFARARHELPRINLANAQTVDRCRLIDAKRPGRDSEIWRAGASSPHSNRLSQNRLARGVQYVCRLRRLDRQEVAQVETSGSTPTGPRGSVQEARGPVGYPVRIG